MIYIVFISLLNNKGYVNVALLNNNLTTQLTANEQKFQFGYDTEKDKYGYIVKVDGADTFFPFSQGIDKDTVILNNGDITPSDGYLYGIFSINRSGSGRVAFGIKAITPQSNIISIIDDWAYDSVVRVNLESNNWVEVPQGSTIQHFGSGSYKGTCIFIPN